MGDNVILLDKYDLYAADMNPLNIEFLKKSNLKPIPIDSDTAKNIIKNKTYQSGSIFIPSEVQFGRYYSLLNSIKDFSEEFKEILFKYAPYFNVKTIYLKKDLQHTTKEQSSSTHKAHASNGFNKATGKCEFENSKEKEFKYSSYEKREFLESFKTLKDAVETMTNDGINYKEHRVLNELSNSRPNRYESKVEFSESLEQSSNILGELNLSAPLLRNLKANYEYAKENINKQIQISSLELIIEFY